MTTTEVPAPAPAIEIDDTVRIAGERRTAIVESINRRTGILTVSRVVRTGYRSHRVSVWDVAPDRVTLARKGNRELDAANEVLIACGLEPIAPRTR